MRTVAILWACSRVFTIRCWSCRRYCSSYSYHDNNYWWKLIIPFFAVDLVLFLLFLIMPSVSAQLLVPAVAKWQQDHVIPSYTFLAGLLLVNGRDNCFTCCNCFCHSLRVMLGDNCRKGNVPFTAVIKSSNNNYSEVPLATMMPYLMVGMAVVHKLAYDILAE